jgi:hypothetical protein
MTTRNTRDIPSILIRLAVGAAITLLLLLAVALPAAAQGEAHSLAPERSFYLGMRFLGSSLHVDRSADDIFFVKDDGGGVEFHAGYQFNKVFALELSLGGTRHDTSDPNIDGRFGFAQILALYRFVPGNPFRPYIKGGLGGCGLRLESGDASTTISGGGLVLGGGFDYFFSRHFSLGADLTHNIVQYNEAEFRLGSSAVSTEIDEEGAMTSLGLSFAYYF